MDLQQALYRRNNKDQPYVWYGEVVTDNSLILKYGILGKTIITETISTGNRSADALLLSKITSKRKEGYISLNEVTDQGISPVEESQVLTFLNTYLPYDRQSSTGAMLPQLAKIYDNTDNKLFKDNKCWYIQFKINGLRCGIGAVDNHGDLFKPIKLTFQSREGTYWNSLSDLEEYLLISIPKPLLKLMVEESYILDGEIYLPGKTVNDINSIVKTPKDKFNKDLQFWCYDIATPNLSQTKRFQILQDYLFLHESDIICKNDHLNNYERLVLLETHKSSSHEETMRFKATSLIYDFEGFILRDPYKEYQFGKRNSAMHKGKATIDGKFIILQIINNGDKRGLPLLLLKNDINDSTFSVHASGSFDYQMSLISKIGVIGSLAYVTYGERSGVKQLPFHVKEVVIQES